MAGKVLIIKVVDPLKLYSDLTENYTPTCHYSYNLPFSPNQTPLHTPIPKRLFFKLHFANLAFKYINPGLPVFVVHFGIIEAVIEVAAIGKPGADLVVLNLGALP